MDTTTYACNVDSSTIHTLHYSTPSLSLVYKYTEQHSQLGCVIFLLSFFRSLIPHSITVFASIADSDAVAPHKNMCANEWETLLCDRVGCVCVCVWWRLYVSEFFAVGLSKLLPLPRRHRRMHQKWRLHVYTAENVRNKKSLPVNADKNIV